MKKRILSIIIAIVMMVVIVSTFAVSASAADITSSQPAVGDGSEGNPYQITSAGELYWFAEYVNAGNASACAKLMNDITVNENVIVNGTLNSDTSNFVAWTPIGVRIGSSTKAFSKPIQLAGTCDLIRIAFRTVAVGRLCRSYLSRACRNSEARHKSHHHYDGNYHT